MRRNTPKHKPKIGDKSPKAGLAIAWAAENEAAVVLEKLGSSENGLSKIEAWRRLAVYGRNTIVSEKHRGWPHRLLSNARNPLCVLLLILGLISYFTGDEKVAVLIGAMLFLSVILRTIQEWRSDAASERLKAMVRTTAAVIRGKIKKEVPLDSLVPGDIVHLSAGDMVPADLRLVVSRDLYINQASLTGESLPVEKHAPPVASAAGNPLDLPNICFMGTNVGSGTAVAVVIATSSNTRFGALAKKLAEQPETPTSFDRGVDRYAWLMIRFVLVMVPAVFLINGFCRGDWLQAFLFALAVAVGLTPELLPMIVTVNLSRGALDMSRKKVIVKRLNAIQDLGAMDVLCTDKTGTLTEGRVALVRYLDIEGKENQGILDYAFLNSYYQTGLSNLLDEAILKHEAARDGKFASKYRKIDEIPFDFKRRRMSVAVEDEEGRHILICKGAVEEVLSRTSQVMVSGQAVNLEKFHHENKEDIVRSLSAEGFRLIALAYRPMPDGKSVYSAADEENLILLGFLAFLDPPKETASYTIEQLEKYGVRIKVLTGDNELVTRKICSEVGLAAGRGLLESEVEGMSDEELEQAADEATVFYKMEPGHKERIIRALQRRGHVVGFLGDGINDALALKAADVGISVDSAVDIAKESSDIILLEKSLLVLKDGVLEGRRAFGNIIKYIKMTASSNFGNMFSVVGGSVFLPFLPMLPLQVIANNLLYDLSQTAIPTDSVDEEYLLKPRQWNIGKIRQYILHIGPVSSIFDYATFLLMLFVFNAWADPALFHTGWFVESLLTQTLIIHIIRTNKIPFIQSRASRTLTLATLFVAGLAVWLPYSPLAGTLGFAPLPPVYWLYVGLFLVAYLFLTQVVKKRFVRRYGLD